MRRALIGAAVVIGLAACGGQSAEQQRVAKCEAQAKVWAQNYTSNLGPGVSNATERGLAQATAKVCIDQKP